MANKWRNTLQDADGNDFLGGAAAFHVKIIPTDVTPYEDHPAGAIYSARDGKYYFNGLECTPGILTDGGGVAINRQSWRQANIDPMGGSDCSGTIAANGVDIATITIAAGQFCYMDTFRTWFVTGDFDISVYVTNAVVAVHEIYAWLQLIYGWLPGHLSSIEICRAWRNAGLHTFYRDMWSNGAGPISAVDTGHIADAGWNGLRITRAGTFYNTFYKTAATKLLLDAAGWVQHAPFNINLAGADCMDANPVVIRLLLSQGGGNGSVDFTNMLVNVGGTDNHIGLSREPFSIKRGNRDDVPEVTALVGTTAGMDLLDVTNNRLYARFDIGANNFLSSGGDNKQKIVHSDYADYGVIHCAFGSDDGNQGGYGVLDLRGNASAIMNAAGYRNYDAAESLVGLSMTRRNSGEGFQPNVSDLKLPANATLAVSTYVPTPTLWNTYQHYAIATKSGLIICKAYIHTTFPLDSNLQRWAASEEAGIIYDCWINPVDGMLFGLSATNMFSVALATWEAELPYDSGDSIAIVGTTCTLTKAATVFPASFIGREIYVAGCTNGGNDGFFIVTGVGVNSVVYTNAAGVDETSPFYWTVRGSFASDVTKALVGTYTGPTIIHQHSFIVLGNVVYISAIEGIYECTWPGGTIGLMYGAVGSGAPYRLPQNAYVTAMELVYEGATPYIMVSAKYPAINRSKVFLINPATHSLDRYVDSDLANGIVSCVDAI